MDKYDTNAARISVWHEHHDKGMTNMRIWLEDLIGRLRTDPFNVMGSIDVMRIACVIHLDEQMELYVRKLQNNGDTMVAVGELRSHAQELLLDYASNSNSCSDAMHRLRHNMIVQLLAETVANPFYSRIPAVNCMYEAHFETTRLIAQEA